MNKTGTLAKIISGQQVKRLFGDEDEIKLGDAVIAGVIAASKELLTEPEFKVLIQLSEIDPIQLAQLLELANGDAGTNEQGTIET